MGIFVETGSRLPLPSSLGAPPPLGLVEAIGDAADRAVRGRMDARWPRPLLRPLWRGRLAGSPDVRLPNPIAGFRAQGRFSQLSAINRHNQRLFDDLVGAQQNRRGYGKTERLGGLEVQHHLELVGN